MITEILTERQEALRAEERQLLAELETALRRLGDPAAEAVAAASRQLDGLFVLSVAGAPEAPVDTLSGALVGDPPPPDLAVAVRPAGEPEPGGHPPADLALFLTSGHRPLAPAEHPLLRAAAEGAHRLLVVVDEAEMLRLSEDLGRMEEAVEVTAERILGRRPLALMVQMVSTALVAGRPPVRESLVPTLAGRIVGVLRSPEVLRPKLLRPLDDALAPARERLAAVSAELTSLGEDLANLEVLEGELEGLRERSERALREAEAEVERAVADFAARAGRVVRRGSRPFPLPRRLDERFSREAVAELPDRLREIAADLEERIGGAAAAGRTAVVERVASFPTERTRASGGAPAGSAAAPSAPGSGPVAAELERVWPGRWDREGTGRIAAELRRTSLVSLVLLAVGLAFAAVPVLSAAAGGAGMLAVALGGGLGGASILAALATLKLGRRRLTDELAGRVEDLRAGAAAALAAGAERAVEDGRVAIREPVARYADRVAEERDRLTAGREALERLAARLEDLRARLTTA